MTLQDFSTIRTYVNTYKDDYKQQDEVDAFYYLGLELILGIPDDEIADSITDNNYLVKQKTGKGGHDRGIDAVYIDESDISRPIIHFFNFKHTSKFEKAQEFIQSGEIEKILRKLLLFMVY